jgi:hypothetical protein
LFKLLVKLALAALIANAAWRVGSAYLTFYKFKDAVAETAQFGNQKSKAELQQLAADAFSVRRDDRNHTVVDGSYTQPVDVLPGYRYLWPFVWHVDVITFSPSKAEPSGA